MSTRERKTGEYWKGVIEDFLKSGKSQKEYVRENKLSRATLWSWSKQLGIPLSQRKMSFSKRIKKEESASLSFTDVQVLGRAMINPSLKIEIIFPQGHTLKLETERAWEEAGSFIKALVG